MDRGDASFNRQKQDNKYEIGKGKHNLKKLTPSERKDRKKWNKIIHCKHLTEDGETCPVCK
jgi:hypothetical protein